MPRSCLVRFAPFLCAAMVVSVDITPEACEFLFSDGSRDAVVTDIYYT